MNAQTVATAGVSLTIGLLAGSLWFSGDEDTDHPGVQQLVEGAELSVRRVAPNTPRSVTKSPRIKTKPFVDTVGLHQLRALEKQLAAMGQRQRVLMDILRRVLGPGMLDPEVVAQELDDALRSSADRARFARLVAALAALGPQGLELLRTSLASDDAEQRKTMLKLLEALDDPAAIPDFLRVALEDENRGVRRRALAALATQSSPAAIDALWDVYRAPATDDAIRASALAGLALQQDDEGLREAVGFLRRDDVLEGWSMTSLLKQSKAHLMPLAVELEQRMLRDRTKVNLLSMVVSYYRKIGSPAATERLHRLAQDPEVPEHVRKAAEVALER